jgi:hypothetical protein
MLPSSGQRVSQANSQKEAGDKRKLKVCRLFHGGHLLGLIYEYGGNMFFRNVGEVPDCMALQVRRWYSSENKEDMEMYLSPLRRHGAVSLQMYLALTCAPIFYSYTAVKLFTELAISDDLRDISEY